MNRLDILLLRALNGHEVHRGPTGSFYDGLCIIRIIFIRLYEGLYELRTNQLDRMATPLKNSRPVIGSAA